jgi:predicted N-acetyltransferase YhbS
VLYVPALDRAQVALAARQNHPLWGGDRSPAEHVAHTRRQLAAAGPELLRYVGLVDERGRVMASIKRFSLLLREGAGEARRAVGIGAVFTPPEARGRGLATELLGAVMAEARDLGYAAALLYSDIAPDIYERLGFVGLPARDWTVDAGDLPPVARALEVRRARAGDEPRLLAWYEEAWRRDHPSFLRPARTPAIWRFFCSRNRVRGVWIVRRRGRDAGYVIAGPDDPRRDLPDPREPRLLWFDEAAAPGVPAERLWATVHVLAARSRATRVRGWLGPAGAPPGAGRMARPSSFPMIAPLVPDLRVRPRRSFLDPWQHF